MKIPHPRNKLIRRLLGYISAIVCFFFIRLDVKGRKNLPKNGPYIIAPNHIDNIDPFPLTAAIKKPVTYLMAEDLNPLKWYEAWGPWSYGVLLVNRKKIQLSTIKALHKQIKKGETVCIFPEGTAIGSKLKRAKNGAAFFAARHKIPIIPTAIAGTNKALKNLKNLKRTKVSIEFGVAIQTQKEDQNNIDALTSKVMYSIERMLPKEYV